MIAGPSGVGKGTIADALVRRDPKLWLSRSWTTRPPRPGERPDAYHFVDRATFEAKAEAGGFLEWATVFGHLYGTPGPEADADHDVLFEIDVQGARQVRDKVPDAVVVFVTAPSREVQAERLRGRGDPPEAVARRLASAADEEAEGRSLADHLVINDELDRAVAEVAGIVDRERQRPNSPSGRRDPPPDLETP